MSKVAFLCVCVLLLSMGAYAQGAEAYIGGSHFTTGKNGWNASAGYDLTKTFNLNVDFGGYYSHNNDIHSFMAGAKLQSPRRRRGFQPWGHLLFGPSHVSRRTGPSDTAFSWALGAGVDATVYKNFGLRLTGDAFHTDFNHNGDWHLRVGAGLVYHFRFKE